MDAARLDEILRRLEALERRLDDRDRDRGGERDRDRGRDEGDHDHERWRREREARREGGCRFDEKRVVDLVVRLVTEHVDELLDEKLARLERRSQREP